jgi:hypothetical protein
VAHGYLMGMALESVQDGGGVPKLRLLMKNKSHAEETLSFCGHQ